MVLTFKKDWSPDLSYSSLAQDQKAWNSKGFTLSSTTRGNIGFPSQQSNSVPAAASFTKKISEDREYNPKRDIGREAAASPRRYSVLRSDQRRDIDSVAMLHADTRHVRSVSPYPLPLGPGSYLGAGQLPGRTEAGHAPPPGTKASMLGSSSFTSPERQRDAVNNLPDMSDALTRNSKDWTSRGFYTSRATRSVSSSSFWESGSASHPTQATGGLLRMAQSSATPAFDTMYDCTHPGMELSRDVLVSPMRYSGAFRSTQLRLANKPTARTNDSRMRSENNCMGESGRQLGPGYYGSAVTMDGRAISPGGALSPESLVRGGASMMRIGTGSLFSSGFRAPAGERNTGMSATWSGGRNENSNGSQSTSPVAVHSYSSG
mmetsp:Transcript_483/g.749  ORF Transcript_483/g.749 Transcript_483/m.749 type:complete len:376 (-) Transcript_483:55-1182(-)